jgi:nucleotide-binding universal stress UspA family protein
MNSRVKRRKRRQADQHLSHQVPADHRRLRGVQSGGPGYGRATGSEVHIVYVTSTVFLEEMSESFHAQAEEHAQTLLGELAEQMKSEGAPVAGTYLRASHPDKEIVRLAEELDVGTIVMGSGDSARSTGC